MVIDMYSLVENIVGISLLIWGLAVIINKHIIKSYMEIFTNIEENQTLSYLTASMFLTLGLITVSVHNDWYFYSTSLFVTIIGWSLTIKASLWLFFPYFFSKMAKKIRVYFLNFWFRFIYGSILLLLGLLILSKDFQEL